MRTLLPDALPFLLTLLFVCFCAAPVIASGPPKGAKWEPIPELTDEFNGKVLDAAKWHDRNPQWKGREPGFFSPKNVTVKDGKLHLTARAENLPGLPEGYHTFTTAAVKSRTTVLYGYFEVRARAMKSHASSAFWFYDSTPQIWTEIDVFEIGGAAKGEERNYHMNAHVFHTPTVKEHLSFGEIWKAPYDLAAEYHVYALEWDEKQIKWLVDGKVVRTLENKHWHQPLYLNFDSETMPQWFGLPKKEELPATFSVEYVRSWRRKAGANAR